MASLELTPFLFNVVLKFSFHQIIKNIFFVSLSRDFWSTGINKSEGVEQRIHFLLNFWEHVSWIEW